MTEVNPQDTEGIRAALDAPALVAEAAQTSRILWLGTDTGTYPVWHAIDNRTLYLVSGPGEQYLPWLPETVTVTFRSKDSGARLVTVDASAHVLMPDTPSWATATAALAPQRLNAAPGLVERWAAECTIHAIHPYGPAREPSDGDGRVVVEVSPAGTAGWRPWHFRGRARRGWRARHTEGSGSGG